MENLEYKIENVTQRLDNVIEGFEMLDFETFDAIFPKIVEEMKKANVLRENLLIEYGSEKLINYDPELTRKAKLIELKFDNILGVFSKEGKRLERELAANSTRRKITNYIRY